MKGISRVMAQAKKIETTCFKGWNNKNPLERVPRTKPMSSDEVDFQAQFAALQKAAEKEREHEREKEEVKEEAVKLGTSIASELKDMAVDSMRYAREANSLTSKEEPKPELANARARLQRGGINPWVRPDTSWMQSLQELYTLDDTEGATRDDCIRVGRCTASSKRVLTLCAANTKTCSEKLFYDVDEMLELYEDTPPGKEVYNPAYELDADVYPKTIPHDTMQLFLEYDKVQREAKAYTTKAREKNDMSILVTFIFPMIAESFPGGKWLSNVINRSPSWIRKAAAIPGRMFSWMLHHPIIVAAGLGMISILRMYLCAWITGEAALGAVFWQNAIKHAQNTFGYDSFLVILCTIAKTVFSCAPLSPLSCLQEVGNTVWTGGGAFLNIILKVAVGTLRQVFTIIPYIGPSLLDGLASVVGSLNSYGWIDGSDFFKSFATLDSASMFMCLQLLYRFTPSLFYKLGNFLKLSVRSVLLLLPSSVVIAGDRVVAWFDKMMKKLPLPGKNGMDSFMWALRQISMHRAAYANTWNLLIEVYAWFTDLFHCTVNRLLPGGKSGIKCCTSGMFRSWVGAEQVKNQQASNGESSEPSKEPAGNPENTGEPAEGTKDGVINVDEGLSELSQLATERFATLTSTDITFTDTKKLIDKGEITLTPKQKEVYDIFYREACINDNAPKRGGQYLVPQVLIHEIAPKLLDPKVAEQVIADLQPNFSNVLEFFGDRSVSFEEFDTLRRNGQVILTPDEENMFFDVWNQLKTDRWIYSMPRPLLIKLTKNKIIKDKPSDPRLKVIIKRNVATVAGITLNLYRWKTTPRALQLIQSVPRNPVWNPEYEFVSFSARLVARKYPAAVHSLGPFKVLHVDVSKLPKALRNELARQNAALCGKRTPCYGT